MMREYIGPLGGLVGVRVASSLVSSREPRGREVVTVEGVRRFMLAPTPLPRAWDVEFPFMDFGDADILGAFALGLYGNGPWVWVPSDAQVGSVLTPAQSALRNLSSEFTQAGPVVIDGQPFPVSASFSLASSWRGLVDVPVVPGVPVTASVWVQSATGAPIISTAFYVGDTQLDPVSVTGSNGGMWQRLTWSGVAPAGATQIRLGVRSSVTAVAGPQVTWTDHVVPFASGRAASEVVVESVEQSPSLVRRTSGGLNPLADVSMRVLEVGNAGW